MRFCTMRFAAVACSWAVLLGPAVLGHAQEKEKTKADEKKDKKGEKKDAEPKLKDAKPTVKLTFGKKDNNVVYVRRETGSDKAIVAVPATLLAKVDQGRLAYLDRTLPSFSENADVSGLVLQRGGQTFDSAKEQLSIFSGRMLQVVDITLNLIRHQIE